MAFPCERDDGFDDWLDDEVLARENEWSKSIDSRLKEGYRDGLEVGQDLKLQEGFNKGFKESAVLSAELASLKGTISALLSFNLVSKKSLLSEEGEQDFQKLLEDIGSLQECALDNSPSSWNSSHPQSDISEIKLLAEKLGLIKVAAGDSEISSLQNEISIQNAISSSTKNSSDGKVSQISSTRGATLKDLTTNMSAAVLSPLKLRMNNLLAAYNLQQLIP